MKPNHITAKKHFSQNFLVDPFARQKVLTSMKQICDLQNIPILEIGPGQGDVTKQAVDWNHGLIAIEIDPEAVEYLQNEIQNPNFELIHADIMQVIAEFLPQVENTSSTKKLIKKQTLTTYEDSSELNSVVLPNNFSLISSLPYHIGSRLLVDLAVLYPHVNFGIIHQKEVVLKTQNSSNFTFFGAWLNLFWNCKYCFDLPKHCFSPQPKIVSAFLQGYSLNSQDLDWLQTSKQRQKTKIILKKLFSFPNKTLVNNLKQLDWNTQKILKFVEQHCENNLKLRLGWNNYKHILAQIIAQSDQ